MNPFWAQNLQQTPDSTCVVRSSAITPSLFAVDFSQYCAGSRLDTLVPSSCCLVSRRGWWSLLIAANILGEFCLVSPLTVGECGRLIHPVWLLGLWLHEGVSCPGQTLVLLSHQSHQFCNQGFLGFRTSSGCEPTLGVPFSSVPLHSVPSPLPFHPPIPHPFACLRSKLMYPTKRPGECCKLPQWGLGMSPNRN